MVNVLNPMNLYKSTEFDMKKYHKKDLKKN